MSVSLLINCATHVLASHSVAQAKIFTINFINVQVVYKCNKLLLLLLLFLRRKIVH